MRPWRRIAVCAAPALFAGCITVNSPLFPAASQPILLDRPPIVSQASPPAVELSPPAPDARPQPTPGGPTPSATVPLIDPARRRQARRLMARE